MRRLGTFSDHDTAERFRDYLFVQGIDTRIDRNGTEWVIWVHDEDRIDQARSELTRFQTHPDDPKYAEARSTAEVIQNQRVNEAVSARQRYVQMSERWRGGQTRIPVTAILIMMSVWVAIVTRLGLDENAVTRFLFAEWYLDDQARRIAYDSLWGIFKKREYYRLIAPIFLHFGPFHLLFNMSATLAYGRVIEQRSGSLRFIGIVLTIALVSNLSQYLWSGPNFGGMSGVDFGLLGFLWMKSRFAADYGVWMDRDYIVRSLIFLILCMTGLIGPIANAAHVAGLVSGMTLAFVPLIPRIWRRYKNRLQ